MRTSATIILSCLLLLGCGGEEHEDIKAWMQESTKDMKGRVPPLPQIKPFPLIAYDSGSLVDPFRAARIEPEKKAGGGGLRPDFDRRREPLEAYPLESLKMVGTLQKKSAMHAIIQADKNVHQVRTGNYLGQNFGVVTRVTDSAVALKELIQDPNGDWTERESTLQLQEKQQEGQK